jgi:hypothetical protein
MTAHGYEPGTADPTPGPTYLEEAADQLRMARAANEARAAGVHSWLTEADVPVLTEINDRRMELAAAFAALASIANGTGSATIHTYPLEGLTADDDA